MRRVASTPYSTERFPTAYDAAVYFAQRGYVYAFEDIRGRHESEGTWEQHRGGLRHDGQGAGGAADRLPRRRASLPHPAARDSTAAAMTRG
jgi:hypothetical protein